MKYEYNEYRQELSDRRLARDCYKITVLIGVGRLFFCCYDQYDYKRERNYRIKFHSNHPLKHIQRVRPSEKRANRLPLLNSSAGLLSAEYFSVIKGKCQAQPARQARAAQLYSSFGSARRGRGACA